MKMQGDSIKERVETLRIFLWARKYKKPNFRNSKRFDLVEDLYSLLPVKEVHEKYFKYSMNPHSQTCKYIKRICDYVGLKNRVTPADIRLAGGYIHKCSTKRKRRSIPGKIEHILENVFLTEEEVKNIIDIVKARSLVI